MNLVSTSINQFEKSVLVYKILNHSTDSTEEVIIKFNEVAESKMIVWGHQLGPRVPHAYN